MTLITPPARHPATRDTPASDPRDPRDVVAARRIAWQRAFESALRLPWSTGSIDAATAGPRTRAAPTPSSDGASPHLRGLAGERKTVRTAAAGRVAVGASSAEAHVMTGPRPRSGVNRSEAIASSPAAGVPGNSPGTPDRVAPPARARPQTASRKDEMTETSAERSRDPSARSDAAGVSMNTACVDGGVDRRDSAHLESQDHQRIAAGGASLGGPAKEVFSPSGSRDCPGGVAAGRVTPPPDSLGRPGAAPAGTRLDRLQTPETGDLLVADDPPRTPRSGRRGGPIFEREAVRCHFEWSEEGVRVWLGVDRDGDLPPQLANALLDHVRRLVESQGARLLAVVCNGSEVRPCTPDASSRRSADEAPGAVDDPRARAFEEVPIMEEVRR